MDEAEEAAAGLTEREAADVRTVARGGAVQIAGQVTQRGLSFIFTFVALRILGRAPYGLYRQVAQILAIAGQLGLAGFNYASMRFIARARANQQHSDVRGAARTGLVGAGVASALVVIALLLLSGRLGRAFGDDRAGVSEFARLLRLGVAFVPLFAVTQVLRYCTQAYKTMVPSVMTGNVIQPLARFVLGVALLAAGFEVAGAVSSLALSAGAGAVAGAWYYRRILAAEERSATPRYQVGPMVRFALPQAGASLLGVQTLGLGIILLGLYSGDAQAGLFGVALALQGPGTVFLGGIVNIWAPVVSELHSQGEIHRLGSLYQTINRWIATFSFPFFAVLLLEADLFVRLLGGNEATGSESIVAILAAGNFFYTGTGPTGYVLSMTGRPGVNFVNSVVSVAAYVMLGAWAIPRHGIVGMAVVHSIVTALVNIVRVIEARVLVGVQPFGRSFLKPVVATFVGAGIVFAWRLLPWNGTASELTAIAVGGCAYVVVLRLLGIDPEERYVLDRIKKRAMGGKGRA